MLDGQQLPQIGFAQTLNELTAARVMAPVIVVAVYSTEGDLRREELAGKPSTCSVGAAVQMPSINLW